MSKKKITNSIEIGISFCLLFSAIDLGIFGTSMDHDFRNKPGSAYDASQIPMYSQLSGNRMYGQPPPSSSSSPSSLYPKISQSGPTVVPSAGRHFPHNQTSASPSSCMSNVLSLSLYNLLI